MFRRGVAYITARDLVKCDLCVVGAGPAGLAAAIRYKQVQPKSEVVVLDRGLEVGAHILSGACFEPRALDELLPNWRLLDSPVRTKVEKEAILLLDRDKSWEVSSNLLPATLSNANNYVISLGELCKWLAVQAKSLGVKVISGFAADDLVISSRGFVSGVVTGAAGKSKTSYQDQGFQPSLDIEAPQTIFAEGAKGLLSERLIRDFKLRAVYDSERVPAAQTYGLGLKESWSVPGSTPGLCLHTFHWPLSRDTFGYGFLYTQEKNRVHAGFVVGLDYKNANFDPHHAFQQWKTHPDIRKHLTGGTCLGFGAKVISLGGVYSLPKLTFPGGALVGCAAGLFNTAKNKGIHIAMKSGMLAAEAIATLDTRPGQDPTKYYDLFRRSWVSFIQAWEELHSSRNFRQGFYNNTTWGLLQAYASFKFFKGKRTRYILEPRGSACSDSERTQWPKDSSDLRYETPDGTLTFGKERSFELSGSVISPGTNPVVQVKETSAEDAIKSLRDFKGIETKICPVGVFALTETGDLSFAASKCILCKACEVKTPGEYLTVKNPEGGEGPN